MRTINSKENVRDFNGEVEIEVKYKDKKSEKYTYKNIIKSFAKEIISHSIASANIWDAGSGAWVSGVDYSDYLPKYILLGASYDTDGDPIGLTDTRFYEYNAISGYQPVTLTSGATNEGDLINPIPISDPTRPLKKVEDISFESSYQPAGSPLLNSDVRAINNVVVYETTLLNEEYNGLTGFGSDSFLLTEIALAGGRYIITTGDCESTPSEVLEEGPYAATVNGGNILTLDEASNADSILEGDQIRISTDSGMDISNPFYLVTDKFGSGRDIQLDRDVTDDSSAYTGDVSIYKSTLRMFSHRILSTPITKDSTTEIVIRWRIYLA